MKIATLRNKDLYEFRYLEDVERMVRIAEAHEVSLNSATARAAWENYSEECCAFWKDLPKNDDEIWEILKSKLEFEGNDFVEDDCPFHECDCEPEDKCQ